MTRPRTRDLPATTPAYISSAPVFRRIRSIYGIRLFSRSRTSASPSVYLFRRIPWVVGWSLDAFLSPSASGLPRVAPPSPSLSLFLLSVIDSYLPIRYFSLLRFFSFFYFATRGLCTPYLWFLDFFYRLFSPYLLSPLYLNFPLRTLGLCQFLNQFPIISSSSFSFTLCN